MQEICVDNMFIPNDTAIGSGIHYLLYTGFCYILFICLFC